MLGAFDHLYADNGAVLLLNCDVTPKRVLTGLAYFSPNLPELVTVRTPEGLQIGAIKIPADVRKSWMAQMYSSANDDIELEFTRYSA